MTPARRERTQHISISKMEKPIGNIQASISTKIGAIKIRFSQIGQYIPLPRRQFTLQSG